MDDKEHQSHNTSYQIRVDGKPVYFPSNVDKFALGKYAELCEQNPDCYVDIVLVHTQILFSQFEYDQMKTHFEKTGK